jgi:hypothetical protein
LKVVDFDGRLHGILPLDHQAVSHLRYLDVFGTQRQLLIYKCLIKFRCS